MNMIRAQQMMDAIKTEYDTLGNRYGFDPLGGMDQSDGFDKEKLIAFGEWMKLKDLLETWNR